MKKTIEIKLIGQIAKAIDMKYIEVHDCTYRFNGKVSEPILFVFKHEQRHTRLDLTNVKNSCLISFDKYLRVVGFTGVNNLGSGPYELYNKQRVFILASENKIDQLGCLEYIQL